MVAVDTKQWDREDVLAGNTQPRFLRQISHGSQHAGFSHRFWVPILLHGAQQRPPALGPGQALESLELDLGGSGGFGQWQLQVARPATSGGDQVPRRLHGLL